MPANKTQPRLMSHPSSNHEESSQPPHAVPDSVDDILTQHLEAFLEEWETNGFGPLLSDHLPRADALLRRTVLIELIKVDLEYRLQSGGPVLDLEDYLAEYPELGEPDGLPAELIHEDFHARKSAGVDADLASYLKRFPDKADTIARHFHLETTTIGDVTGEQLAATYQPGQRIDDFYLMNQLGTGAFGSVFLARQESMQRMVALKISGDKGTEGQTLAQLDHPNIVRVYDQVRLSDRNIRLLYMQFAAGGTLQTVIRKSRIAKIKSGAVVRRCVADAVAFTGVFSEKAVTLKNGLAEKSWPQVVCQIGRDLARALEHAHEQGVLHRDVKPANVLLDANGTAKLADFNISFNAEAQDARVEENFGGSLAYMSPEQLDACSPISDVTPADVDERSDVYSLAVMLWELMHGHRPFDDESITGNWTETVSQMAELRRKGVAKKPAKPNSVASQLNQILRTALNPNPAERYLSAGELSQELGLAMQPQVARLLQKSQGGWRGKVRNPWIAGALILLAAMIPNIVAGVFNFEYNVAAIIQPLPDTQRVFDKLQMIVNAIAYPIGFGVTLWFLIPLLKSLKPGTTYKNRRHQRRRSLAIGPFVAGLGMTLWVIAGLIYPFILHMKRPGGLELHWHVHFFSSLLVCGLIAAAYPFFVASSIAVKSVFPHLLRRDTLTAEDAFSLRKLLRQSIPFLYLAGGVPALGMLFLLLIDQNDTHSQTALKVLSALGAIGFGLMLNLARSLQSDIEGLLEAANLLKETE